MDIREIIEKVGAEKVLDEMLAWLNSDILEAMTKDIAIAFDLDVEEADEDEEEEAEMSYEELREKQKEVALGIMEKMDLYKPYIEKFKKDGTVTLYEQYAGFYIDEDTEHNLYERIKKFEEEHGCLVYAVTHEFTQFGECYDFLIVTKYKEEWADTLSYSQGTKHVVFAYVNNEDDEFCSEFGDITVNQFGGGLTRVA